MRLQSTETDESCQYQSECVTPDFLILSQQELREYERMLMHTENDSLRILYLFYAVSKIEQEANIKTLIFFIFCFIWNHEIRCVRKSDTAPLIDRKSAVYLFYFIYLFIFFFGGEAGGGLHLAVDTRRRDWK